MAWSHNPQSNAAVQAAPSATPTARGATEKTVLPSTWHTQQPKNSSVRQCPTPSETTSKSRLLPDSPTPFPNYHAHMKITTTILIAAPPPCWSARRSTTPASRSTLPAWPLRSMRVSDFANWSTRWRKLGSAWWLRRIGRVSLLRGLLALVHMAALGGGKGVLFMIMLLGLVLLFLLLNLKAMPRFWGWRGRIRCLMLPKFHSECWVPSPRSVYNYFFSYFLIVGFLNKLFLFICY